MKSATHRPFVYLGGSFAFGIFLERFVNLSFGILAIFITACLLLGTGLRRKNVLSTTVLLIAIMGLGIAHAKSRKFIPEDHIEHVARYYYKKSIKIDGVIISDVQVRGAVQGSKRTFTLDVGQILTKWGWRAKKGKLLVNVFGDENLAYGDHVLLEGKLHRPFNFSAEKNFSYRDYLARRGIYLILSIKKGTKIKILGHNKGDFFKAASLNLRNRFANVLSHSLSRNEAGIMKAILLGDRSAVPKPIRTLFVQTGTAHILAISGLHIGIVVALFLVFVKLIPVNRRAQLLIVIGLVSVYAFLTGGRPSVVRAAIMTVIFLASFIFEKEFDRPNTLCLAGFVILIFNPLNLFDAGFQLSFSCVLAIIYADAKMRKQRQNRFLKKRDPWFNYIVQPLYFSLTIWLAVAGLIVYYFGIVTPITILANILVIPLISIIVALGFGLIFTGIVFPAWGFMFAVCLKVVLNFMAGLIFLCDKVPLAHIYIREITIWHIAFYYFIICAIVLIPRVILRRRKIDKQQGV